VPLVFLSFVTAAVSVTVSVGSTVIAEAVTATLGDLEEPPQPEMQNRPVNDKTATAKRTNRFENIKYPPPHSRL
jgi:hypothetical protein